eukprot:6200235-Pleurochrysis_carterae.AAC.1
MRLPVSIHVFGGQASTTSGIFLCADAAAAHAREGPYSVSTSLVKTVMGRLKSASAGGTDEARMQAIQALVDVLQGYGHYCKLILGTVASVRKQAVSFAQARYNGIMKRKCHGADFPPFRVDSIGLSCYPSRCVLLATHLVAVTGQNHACQCTSSGLIA